MAGISATDFPISLFAVFGFGAFHPGNVQPLVSDGINVVQVPAQVDVQATWPDGSIATAMFSFHYDIQAGGLLQVGFVQAQVPSFPSFSPAPELADKMDLEFQLIDDQNNSWNVSMTHADSQNEFNHVKTLSSAQSNGIFGNLAREYESRYRPLRGTTEHSNIEVYVRRRVYHQPSNSGFKGMYVEVSVENARTDGQKIHVPYSDQTLKLDGQIVEQIVANPGSTKSFWRQGVWHWQGWVTEHGVITPNLAVQIDNGYYAAIGLIPSYDPNSRITEANAATLLNRINNSSGRGNIDTAHYAGTPLQLNGVYAYQPGTGDRYDIGHQPLGCTYALNGISPSALHVQRHGDLNGSGVFPVHNRDPNLGYMGLDRNHPKWRYNNNIFDKPGGNLGPGTPNVAHTANLGFCHYLMTGSRSALDEMVSWTAFIVRDQVSCTNGNCTVPQRIGNLGDRKAAWSIRNDYLAAFLLPDTHPLKQVFYDTLYNSVTYWSVNNLPALDHPRGAYGYGGWNSSGRDSWPCATFTSPWQSAWYSSEILMAFKIFSYWNPAFADFYNIAAYNYEWWRGYHVVSQGQSWQHPLFAHVNPVANLNYIVQYSSASSTYTPQLVNNQWSVTPNSVQPIANWAEAQWYEAVSQDKGKPTLGPSDWPNHPPEAVNWTTNSGNYFNPNDSQYDEYGPGRTGLLWLYQNMGDIQGNHFPNINSVINVANPRIVNDAKSKSLPQPDGAIPIAIPIF